MAVIFTSFRRWYHYPISLYSIARWMPSGFHEDVTELKPLAATDKNGNKLLLRNFNTPIIDYRKAYKQGIEARWNEVEPWVKSLKEEDDIALLCWCPYSEPTKKQIKNFGSFYCHGALIARMLNYFRPDITIYMDKDRDIKLARSWMPEKYKILDNMIT